jgi:general secretion pathway protein F
MAIFDVTASDKEGKNKKIRVDAESPKAARAKAKSQGLTPIEVVAVGSAESLAETATSKRLASPFKNVKSEDLSNMTRQLATLVKAHVPVVESLTALVEQIDHEKLKPILIDIRQQVKEGKSLGDAFAHHTDVFNRVYINMVKAGEASGRLDAVLLRLADFGEGQERLKRKITGALMYPIVLVIVALIVVGVILTKVVPQITKIFVDMKKVLPFPTRAIIAASDFTQEWGLVLAAVALGGAVLLERFIKTEAGRAWKDNLMLRAPFISDLMRKLCVARFARTLGTLLTSGVPMLAALQITKNVVSNYVYEVAVERSATMVSEGRSLASTLKGTGDFPPIMVHMVGVGEKSGELEQMLLNVAESYEEQVEQTLGNIASLIEPAMMIVLAGVVGFIVMGVLLPIFDMQEFGAG